MEKPLLWSGCERPRRLTPTARSKPVLPVVAADARRRSPLNFGSLDPPPLNPPRYLDGYLFKGLQAFGAAFLAARFVFTAFFFRLM